MKLVVVVALAAACFGATGASAQGSEPAPQTLRAGEYLTQPLWVRAPSIEVVERLFPNEARSAEPGGRVDAVCDVTAEGRFTDCAVQSETPPGHGLGEATLRALSSEFQIAPTLPDGRPVAGSHIALTSAWGPKGLSLMVRPRAADTASPSTAQPLIVWSVSDWAQIPTADEIADLYPVAARVNGVGAATTMRCAVEKDGGMTDCAIAKEAPNDHGFGAAELALARYFRLHPTTRDGQPVQGGLVIISMKWRLAP